MTLEQEFAAYLNAEIRGALDPLAEQLSARGFGVLPDGTIVPYESSEWLAYVNKVKP